MPCTCSIAAAIDRNEGCVFASVFALLSTFCSVFGSITLLCKATSPLRRMLATGLAIRSRRERCRVFLGQAAIKLGDTAPRGHDPHRSLDLMVFVRFRTKADGESPQLGT